MFQALFQLCILISEASLNLFIASRHHDLEVTFTSKSAEFYLSISYGYTFFIVNLPIQLIFSSFLKQLLRQLLLELVNLQVSALDLMLVLVLLALHLPYFLPQFLCLCS